MGKGKGKKNRSKGSPETFEQDDDLAGDSNRLVDPDVLASVLAVRGG